MNRYTKFFLMLLILTISNGAFAQFSVSLKAGANLSNYVGDVENNLFKSGFQGGVGMEYQLSSQVFIHSGLMAISKGNKYTKGPNNSNELISYSALYAELPLHIAYKIPLGETTNLVLHAGPYLAYGLDGKAQSNVSSYSKDIFQEIKLRRFDYGVGEGIGVEFGKFGVDLSGSFGLTNLSYVDQTKIHNINVYLSLLYKL